MWDKNSTFIKLIIKLKRMKKKINITNALKLKKKMASDIAFLKQKIRSKNSYDSVNDVKLKFDTVKMYDDVLNLTENLIL